MEEPRVQLMPGAYFAAAAGVLLLPLNWLLAGILAAAFHECCHLATLKLCKCSVRQLRIGLCGAQIVTGALTPSQELLCAAAGPMGSLSLMVFARWVPILSILGLVQGSFNLLPIYPLDGGRITRAIFLLAKNRH